MRDYGRQRGGKTFQKCISRSRETVLASLQTRNSAISKCDVSFCIKCSRNLADIYHFQEARNSITFTCEPSLTFHVYSLVIQALSIQHNIQWGRYRDGWSRVNTRERLRTDISAVTYGSLTLKLRIQDL